MFALVDCNNFYASCERVFNPALRLRPVVVLSNNDGCIIARSEEAKALGIQMGMPEFKCRPLLKKHEVAVFSTNFALYGDMSVRVMMTLAALVPEIEVYSIDEAFLDMTSFARFDLTEYARLIRRKVRQHTGIPVCVGMASTKTLAKIANRLAKKNPHYQGVCVLRSDAEIQAALERTKVEDIWGIGRQWSKLLQARRIESAADLAVAPAAWVRKHLHIVSARIQILKAAQTMLDGLFRAGMSYKKAGVIVSGIVPKTAYSTTLSLFADEEPAENERESKIMQVMDAINQRYGSGAVRLAAENSESWKPHQERLSARYTTQWDNIIEVEV